MLISLLKSYPGDIMYSATDRRNIKQEINQVLKDTSLPALIEAIEENLVELSLLYRNWPRAEVYDGADIVWTITDVPFALFNSILRARLAPHQVDYAIEAAINRARSKEVPLLWWIDPNTQPSNLERHLKKHDFSHIGDSPGMAVDLLNLNEHFQPFPELTVKTVNDLATLRLWSRILTRGFELPEYAGNAFFDFYSSIGLDADSPARHYIGWLKGEPVAVSSLVLGSSVAGIYNLATIPGARRQGAGSAMLMKPLQEAQTIGYRIGILQASEMGFSVYRRVGFKEYCRMSHYMWSGDTK
jgi:GNAT superfamily N-acetyltransferase